jgi:hypothetical protein
VPDPGTPLLTAQHRVLRLIMAVGAVAVGLCVVLAMVALVVSLGGSPARNVAKASDVGTAYPRPRDLSGHAPAAVLARYQGKGSGERAFMLRAPGRIVLAWSYQCPAGRAARFTLGQALVPADHGLDQYRTGRIGSGTTQLSEDAGRHVLVVVSDCTWTLSLTRHRAGGGAP